MITDTKAVLVSTFQRLSSVAAVMLFALGSVALARRIFESSVPSGLRATLGTMNPGSALAFVLAAVSLWLLRRNEEGASSKWVSRALPVVVFALGLLSLSRYFFGWNLGVERLFPRGAAGSPDTLNLVLMSPITALNFSLAGLGMVLFRLPIIRRYVYAQCLAVLAGLLSLLFLVEYAYSGMNSSAMATRTPITPPSTLGFVILTLGILFLRPERGLMSVITDSGSGGKLLRRGLLIALVVPFALCWLGMIGPRAGYSGTEFGMALVATSIFCVFASLMWGYATSLAAVEGKRKRAESLLDGQRQIFEMISKDASLEGALTALIRLMEAQGDGFACSILLLDRDGLHLRHGAAPSLPAEYIKSIDGAAIGPMAGSCGTAAFHRQAVLVQDISTDPLWADYKHLALPYGLRACWSTPIVNEKQAVLGTFAIYDSKPLELTPQFVHLVDIATYTAAVCITHHRAGELLRENALRISTIYNSVADVIFQVRVEAGVQFRFDSVNHAFYAATGLTEAQVIGKLVQEVVPEPSLSLVLEKYREAIRTRRTVQWEEETRYSAETRFGDVTVTPVFDTGGACTALIGSVHDMTERKRLEQQVRQAQKMEVVGQLAGGVAHDFNNILTVINGYSEIMLQKAAPNDPNYGCLDEIKRAGQRAASLTRQLLAFSRQQILKPQVLDLNTVINNMEKMLRRLIGEDIELFTVLAEDIGRIKADPGQMEQIVLNLVVNARDAMPRGGKLTIETTNATLAESYAATHLTAKPGPHVMLAVSDTGCGMDAETQKRIFEPFFTTKEPGKGTGLGLSTVYGIVKQSEGNIWVYSEPGIGTSFKVYLPRVDKPAEPLESGKSEAKLPRGTETILLVEDEPSVRRLVRTTLESNGYRVLEATNGAEALRIGDQHQGKIHFLVTDLVMPGISGRVLAEQLVPRRPELKVLFLSGYTDDVVIRHGVLNRGTAFLQKPFTPDALTRKVREVMDS